MTAANVIEFLRKAAARPDVLDSLKTRSKDEVIDAAIHFGYPFTAAEFDSVVWDLEAKLAETRGEPFDPRFGLWQTMWGKYYLEYLVVDLVPSFVETGLV
ncbi:Nif11-like leader peptide family natural product precursor [Actinoplanes sp. KI2]|uniref:Nif11-like leader peptide family natural product precursor n=1 Tax=Actinoplanes sp. KI2 TaxID=2983315 RepID=UPI0021D5C573|nr:Nif11-like leader peptide family natural product precursor [Actinoplanes sp. KI2]MCU7729555.1 Nif11-like leader peptide family natural product precursor [Actinoplanes sp. KI2]